MAADEASIVELTNQIAALTERLAQERQDKLELRNQLQALILSKKEFEDRIDASMKGVQDALIKNTTETSELLSTFKDLKGFFKVVGWCATLVKYVGMFAGGLAAIYAAWKAATGGTQ